MINLAFCLAIILIAVWLVRSLLEQHGRRALPGPSPLSILKHRYTAGDIDREDFERMKREVAP